jgi:NADH:ubiquinone oxidoreductase subunit C
LERELWDEFGLNFGFKNQNLNRRLLTDYGFKGHPLTKNYPITGFYECVYNLEKTRIKTIPLCLVQEYRKFSFKPYNLFMVNH